MNREKILENLKMLSSKTSDSEDILDELEKQNLKNIIDLYLSYKIINNNYYEIYKS